MQYVLSWLKAPWILVGRPFLELCLLIVLFPWYALLILFRADHD